MVQVFQVGSAIIISFVSFTSTLQINDISYHYFLDCFWCRFLDLLVTYIWNMHSLTGNHLMRNSDFLNQCTCLSWLLIPLFFLILSIQVIPSLYLHLMVCGSTLAMKRLWILSTAIHVRYESFLPCLDFLLVLISVADTSWFVFPMRCRCV